MKHFLERVLLLWGDSQKKICVKTLQCQMYVLYCNSLLTKHVTHNINIMQNILKGHNKIKRLDRHDNNQIHK